MVRLYRTESSAPRRRDAERFSLTEAAGLAQAWTAAGACAIIRCMADQSLEFAGLTALVTGASGIGLATTRMLAGRGARVAVLD